jgi:hypothetical protein
MSRAHGAQIPGVIRAPIQDLDHVVDVLRRLAAHYARPSVTSQDLGAQLAPRSRALPLVRRASGAVGPGGDDRATREARSLHSQPRSLTG